MRDILKNLNFTLLAFNVKNEPDHGLAVLMNVEGRNPDVSGGRPVKLNVRLTGDVLNFVQQNILSLTDPRKFLEQNEHAKP